MILLGNDYIGLTKFWEEKNAFMKSEVFFPYFKWKKKSRFLAIIQRATIICIVFVLYCIGVDEKEREEI